MDLDTLGFALAAGMVAAINPCGFAMLPGYLSLVISAEAGAGVGSRGRSLARALTATAVMTAGFLVVFGAFGLVIAPLTTSIEQFLPIVTVVIGAALVGLGAWLLAGRELTVLLPRPGRGAPSARLRSMFGYGLAYALASLSCTLGPFLAVTAATFRGQSVLAGVLAFLVYGLGMALVVGVLAVATALASSAVARNLRRMLPYVNRISGVLLVLSGLYVGYYGVYELRLYLGGGAADDPIIDAAGVVQSFLAEQVDRIGVLPLLIVLGVLVLGAILAGRRWRSHTR
jgi:cytochrome c-type biogenesis protein